MIASNYRRHLEAMQHQRELWSKSSRDTILMRLAGLVFRGSTAPAWWTEARRRAQTLAEAVRRACRDWVDELERSERLPVSGYAAHLRAWNDQRADDRARRAAELLRAALRFGRAAPGGSRKRERPGAAPDAGRLA